MHKRLVNQCLIELEIQTTGPLLIKSGLQGLEGPDMAPVVTFRSRPEPEPYIPGSSLKGVLRSHAERIARTLRWNPDAWHVGACNPFLADKQRKEDWRKPDGACAVKFEERKKPGDARSNAGAQPEDINPIIAYRDSCPACKIFGNTFLLGRLSVPDAYLLLGSSYNRERRDGVGIDRFTGGSAAGAKFDLEVITNATFKVQLQLVNFELWQLGLLAYVLRDLSEGHIGIGSGKSRGLGQISANILKTELFMVTRCLPRRDVMRLWGLTALESAEARTAYGYWQPELEGIALDGAQAISDTLGLRTGYRLESTEAITALWRQTAPLATQYLEPYEIPTSMRL